MMQLFWGARHIFTFIFLSLIIYGTIFFFYLNKFCPRKLLYIPQKTREIKNWFVHFFKKYLEDIQGYIQNSGKHLR